MWTFRVRGVGMEADGTMALIRQSDSLAANNRAIRLDLGDLMRQGESIVSAARIEAERIISDARKERERLIADATRIGHAEGWAKGLQEGAIQGEAQGRQQALAETKDRLTAIEASWSTALDQFTRARDGMMLEAKQEVLRLAIEIGRLVVKTDLHAHPERVTEQLTSVLGAVVRPTRLVLRVHPDDVVLTRDALPSMMQRTSNAMHTEVIEDSSLDRGSVVAGLPSGATIDASIAGQLSRIVEMLLPGESERGVHARESTPEGDGTPGASA